jgi:general L-amino acid transport system permease protein
MAIFIEEFPTPNTFRGANATSSMYFSDSIAFTNRGWYIPKPIFNDGSLAVVVVFLLAIVGMFFFGRWAKARQEKTGDILPVFWIKLAIVIVPTMLMFAVFSFLNGNREYSIVTTATMEGSELSTIQKPKVCVVSGTAESIVLQELLRETGQKVKVDAYDTEEEARTAYLKGDCNTIGVPSGDVQSVQGAVPATFTQGNPILLEQPYLDGFNFKGGLHLRNSLIALWLALSFYTASFIAEAVRAGIMAISKGQSEAAGALGLRQKRIMSLVVLPQAMRVIVPPLISQYLNLTKNSSLAVAVGYMDVTGTLGGITLNQTGRALECILLLMITYLTISLSISMVMNIYNNSVKLKER